MKHLLAHFKLLAMPTFLGGIAFISPVIAAQAAEATDTPAHATILVRPETYVDLDLAKLNARGRVVYISSGAMAFALQMIDNDLRTGFRFPSMDLHPTVIVELSKNDQIHRVSAVYESADVKLDIYLLNELPKNPRDLRALKPIGSIVDAANRGEAAVDFAPTGARYVALQWTRQKPGREPFHVIEVSVLGAVAPDQMLPPIPAEPDLHLPGETVIDFSNKLGTLADAPTIASVSP